MALFWATVPSITKAAGTMTKDKKEDGVQQVSSMRLMAEHVVCVMMGFMGGMVGGFAGWFMRQGTWYGATPIIGAAIGFTTFFCITFFIAGPYEYHRRRLTQKFFVPDMDRFRTLHMESFDLYVTVHRSKNVFFSSAMPELLLVEVEAGRREDGAFIAQRNPVKRTCANTSGVFDECFHFVVAPSDDTLRLALYTKGMLGKDLRGTCYLNIMNDILRQGFPQQTSVGVLNIADQEKDTAANFKDPDCLAGSLVVSFAPGATFPSWALRELEERHQIAFQHLRMDQAKLLSTAQEKGGQYGTWVTRGVEKEDAHSASGAPAHV